ncbi:uncharacterized protein LOC111700431 isoform X2 [Eurytemora carolleeae]|uniref:uncharacterized protein LOC111700431 isoform X2 n=1 Tax=Eurytemora carolleeae TaxID=1294199 RepID=UPI000C76E90A|nr:uncharacterized protein LOC111700431 isoform X2 [Eurytemora carolleeae]|eukprot:XP_023327101.1 uncharacterized protein LOC111700431 isoform X2 [Eurytemora affinis]
MHILHIIFCWKFSCVPERAETTMTCNACLNTIYIQMNLFIFSCCLVLASASINYNPDCENAIRSIGLPRVWRKEDESFPLIYLNSIVTEMKIQTEDKDSETNYNLLSIPLLSCLHQDSPQLVQIIREQFLHKNEENKPYNLSDTVEQVLKKPVSTPNEVDDLVFDGKKKGGFFIEAGANNFESDSDSLHFELNHGWTGLLVEPHPSYYEKGMSKNRRVTSVNTCLSPIDRVASIPFNINYAGLDLMGNKLGDNSSEPILQCIPLYSLLLALGNPTVNYFSLDIEGGEFQVLKTIPWDLVDIQVLSIETHFAGERSKGSREDIISYMKDVGYQYISWGHEIYGYVTFLESGKTIAIINDMFVKNGIPVKKEKKKNLL